MKSFLLLGAAGFLLSVVSASAADRAPANGAATAPAFSWDGMYVGTHAGYGWSDFDFRQSFGGVPANFYSKSDGWLGGVQVGYNVQFAPHWLIGGEIDQAVADMSGVIGGTSDTVKIRSFGSARTRLGYVADRTLFYVTGGMAWANVRSSSSYSGWTVGGGVEYAIDPHWSVKLEYLYADLDGGESNSSAPGLSAHQSFDLTMNVVKAGVNYRFGESGTQQHLMPVKAYRPARDPWSGAYVGLHGGYGWGNPEIPFLPDLDGYFGGFQTGYNWHFAPAWVLGVETDASFGDISGDLSLVGLAGAKLEAKIDRFATARVRLGYVAGPSLWYVTGGAAVADLKWRASVPPLVQNVKLRNIGWTAGGGVEYAIAPDWSVKAEYLYLDVGTEGFDTTAQTVKVGLNYHGPVLERLFGGR